MAYQIYSKLMMIAIYVFVGLQIILLVYNELDVNLFADIMFTLPTAISVCFKMMHYLVRRKQVIELSEMLMKDWCKPRDDEEREKQRKTNEFIENFTIIFNALGQATLFCLLITPFLQNSTTRNLPFRVWLPYDLHDSCNYWITYSLEIAPLIGGVLLNVTADVIVSGFVLQACTQMDILKHRLNQLPDLVKSQLLKGLPVDELQRSFIKKIALHHDFIIKFVKKVTNIFDVIIVEQYVASVLLFSAIVYQFTLGDIPTLQKVMTFGYIICMTGELFTYCWFGNEITLKSLELGEEIVKMDWMMLSKETNKALRFIMLRTSKPIVMSYSNIVVINIDSFKTIMKVTYSAFNVLKRSTN